MKNSIIKNLSVSANKLFAIIFLTVSLVSCGTGYVQCDAYGDSGESVTVLEDDKI